MSAARRAGATLSILYCLGCSSQSSDYVYGDEGEPDTTGGGATAGTAAAPGSGGAATSTGGSAPAASGGAATGGAQGSGGTSSADGTGGGPTKPPLLTPVKLVGTPWLHVEDNWLKDPDNEPVVLRGVAVLELQVLNENRIGFRSAAQRLKAMNANVIRVMVSWENWTRNPDGFFNNHLKPAMDICGELGVYCIIDWHPIEDWTRTDIQKYTRDFWDYVAPKFKDRSYVLYEVFNEPVNPDDWAGWKRVAQPWVDLIRSHAPQNIIIVGSPHYSQMAGDVTCNGGPLNAVADPFVGTNLVYTIHLYPAWPRYCWGHLLGRAAEWVPMFLTEFGFSHEDKAKDHEYYGTRAGYGDPFRAYVDERNPNVSWVAWVYDYEWQPPMVDKNYNLLGGDTYMGQFVAEWLSQKN